MATVLSGNNRQNIVLNTHSGNYGDCSMIDCLQSAFSFDVRRVFNPKQARSQKVAVRRIETRASHSLVSSQSFSLFLS